MIRPRARFRRRRGGTAIVAVVGLTASLITVGVGMDTGRMVVARHKDQTISDAATMAAMVYLPDKTRAQAAAASVINAYSSVYNTSFTATPTFALDGNGLPTSVRVDVTESVPMFLPGMMSVGTRTTQAKAAAGRVIPSRLLQGAVPLGVQYDTTFDLPASGQASPSVITLKEGGGGSDNIGSGNYGALRFSGDNSGASQWQAYLEFGYTAALAVGDSVDSKPGNMNGPTQSAIVTDTSSRLNRAASIPYNTDTYTSFHPGNPRIVAIPLVDWTGINGTKPVPIKGFAAFYIESADSKGNITGRFIRYCVPATTGSAWDGISVDPKSSGTLDGGLWAATMSM